MNKSVFKNASWIIGCKIVQASISFLIGIFTARYLGPSNYGLISYAASIVAFFIPIMQLGFNSTLVQEFINRPKEEGMILGTSLVFNIWAAMISVVGVVSFTSIVNKGEKETIIVCFLYSLTLIFQASEMTQYWFQSKLLSKYSASIALIAYVIISIYKIYILVMGKSIRWFAVTHVIEAAIISLLLLVVYKKVGGKKLSFSLEAGKKMLAKSKYYISSGLMIVVFQQTDRIMINALIGDAETGYYSAAFTCVGISAFVFTAVIDSMRPYILSSRNESIKLFEERLTLLFSMITFLSLVQSVGMTVFAKLIVKILFGEAYFPTVGVLQILVWQVMFGYYGTARNIWILAEEKQQYLWKINLFGAVVNVLGNMYMIPLLGAKGAALASVLTQIFTNVILCFVVKQLHPVGRVIIKSFDVRRIFNMAKMIKN